MMAWLHHVPCCVMCILFYKSFCWEIVTSDVYTGFFTIDLSSLETFIYYLNRKLSDEKQKHSLLHLDSGESLPCPGK